MPIITKSTTNLYFGTGYDQKLPEGWELIESPSNWAMAKTPKGELFFLSTAAAYPCRIATNPAGPHKIGETYIDTKTGVVFLDAEITIKKGANVGKSTSI